MKLMRHERQHSMAFGGFEKALLLQAPYIRRPLDRLAPQNRSY